MKILRNTLNYRCVTKHIFITADTGGKKQHIIIFARAHKDGKGRNPYENSRRKTRKDGKEASPKDNRTPQARTGQGMDRKTATKNAVRYTQHTQVSFQKLLPLLKNSRIEKAEKNVLIQVRANQGLNVKFIKKTTYFAPPPLPHIHT